MPTTNYTPLLGLALPTTGDLSGSWGNEVNNFITTYVDAGVAGIQTISGSQTAVTLSITNGGSLVQVGAGATGSAQYAVINCTGNPASTLVITVPSSSKTYLVNNATSTSQSVTVKGASTTGVTLSAGERAIIAWNGSDFIVVATNNVASAALTGTLPVSRGGTGVTTAQAEMNRVAGAVTSGQYLRGNGTNVVMSAIQAGDVPTLNQNTTGTAAGLSSTLAVTSGGTGQTTYTNGQLLIGNTVGNTLTKATLTQGSGVTITNGNGSITISATGSGGTVTSVGATAPVASSGGTAPTISLNANYGDTLNPYASKTANNFLAAPNGSAGVPTFRAIVAADIPTLNQNTTGTASNVTGTVAVANGGTGATTNTSARTNLGATTVGSNLFTLTNPSAITFPRFNADNTVSALDAGTFRTAIGAGTGSGTVTSVGATSPVASSGGTAPTISLSAGYGDTLNPYASKTANNFLAAPNGSAGAPTFRAIVAADIPTLNQNTTGTASNVTGTVAVANGGSGATTAQGAMNTFAGAVTSGSYLRGNGTNVVMSTIQAGDVPTLNQNTTGTASNVTGTVAVANGGSGATTAQGAMNTFAGGVTSGSYLRGNGTNVVLSAIQAGDVPTLNQNTTGTAANVTGTVAVANGGTGGTTQAAARTGIGAAASGANTDITALDQDVTITATGTIAADTIGYRGIPVNSQTAGYTLTLADASKFIRITTGGVAIPANGTTAFPIGSVITVYNDSASSQNITITTDTLRLAGTATTGTRAVAQRGIATLLKVNTTEWVASGVGVT